MGTHTIAHVAASTDAIDRLHWTVRVATDFYSSAPSRAYVLQWDGCVAFYRDPIPGNSMPGEGHLRLSIPARWTSRDKSSRLYVPNEHRFEFDTDVSPDALDRIEQFRNSGRLYARLEGALTLVHRGSADGAEGWMEGLGSLMGDMSRTPSAAICTEPYELTRDLWCTELLARLRPPGRFIIEVPMPPSADAAGAPHHKAILEFLAEAQRAFDNGRYGEVARVGYQALEILQKVVPGVSACYGDLVSARIKSHVKELMGICHIERHAEPNGHNGAPFDRVLAQFALIGAQNLAGLILAARSTK